MYFLFARHTLWGPGIYFSHEGTTRGTMCLYLFIVKILNLESNNNSISMIFCVERYDFDSTAVSLIDTN